MTHRPGAALLAALLLLTACADGPAPATAPVTSAAPPPPTTATATPSPAVTTSPAPPPFTATDVNDFGKLCGKSDHRAEPSSIYTGPGPHAIVEFGRDADQKEYSRDYLVVRSGAAWDPAQPGDVELLACITGAKAGKRVGTCRYRTKTGVKRVQVDAQRFTIDVFALHSGARVGRTTFTADFCPPGLLSTDGGADLPSRMLSTMTVDDRAAALDTYVKRTA
jgi:hypothetical protein